MTEIITSSQNRWVKQALSLHQRKYRDEFSLFLVEGVRLAEEAIRSEWDIQAILYSSTGQGKGRILALLELGNIRNIPLVEIESSIYNKIAETENPQGITCIIKKKSFQLEQVKLSAKMPLFLVAESVQEPGNIGTLLRTADAAGCSAVFFTKGCADIFSGKAVRASMGSLFHLPIIAGIEAVTLINWLKKQNIRIIATSLASRNIYYETALNCPAAVIFGNEGNGIQAEVLQAADELIYIPIYGQAESLNVAASASIILFEAMRQRHAVL